MISYTTSPISRNTTRSVLQSSDIYVYVNTHEELLDRLHSYGNAVHVFTLEITFSFSAMLKFSGIIF